MLKASQFVIVHGSKDSIYTHVSNQGGVAAAGCHLCILVVFEDAKYVTHISVYRYIEAVHATALPTSTSKICREEREHWNQAQKSTGTNCVFQHTITNTNRSCSPRTTLVIHVYFQQHELKLRQFHNSKKKSPIMTVIFFALL